MIGFPGTLRRAIRASFLSLAILACSPEALSKSIPKFQTMLFLPFWRPSSSSPPRRNPRCSMRPPTTTTSSSRTTNLAQPARSLNILFNRRIKGIIECLSISSLMLYLLFLLLFLLLGVVVALLGRRGRARRPPLRLRDQLLLLLLL